MPTDYRYGGQRFEERLGLYQMGVRWIDPYLNRWVQPDTIIPDPANPQSFNRYSYCLGNPLKFVDPSGHDPLDAAWQAEFRRIHGRDPTADDMLIRLFSIAFPDEWNSDTWNALYTAEGQLETGALETLFHRPPEGRSWSGMPSAISHMAGWYNQGETDAFIRDIGSLFAGLATRFESRRVGALTGGADHPSVRIGGDGLPDELLGADATGNVHHWAWTLNLGYFLGEGTGRRINEFREHGLGACGANDSNCRADVALGNIGVAMGAYMSSGRGSRAPHEFQNAWQLMPALQVSIQ